ncbi:MAG: ABC transporter ATP-binding protein [Deinococcota bacterium]|jgi:simple sugar transport system ATP-binding protein|nr:ABC transporter ATP-binding protein [Deinococcota bacterium]
MGTVASTAVAMQGVSKRFPLVLANDRVDFSVSWGEVHALIGENGAGKSTLMKILYGLQEPDEGRILVDGREVTIRSAKDAIHLGIGMVHQHFMLVEPLTVAENMVLGAEPRLGPSLDYRVARKRTRALIERFGFDIDPRTRVRDLPLGLQQQVEILKALYRDARILIMDEPTAVLTPQETKGLFAFLRDFAAQGNAVVFISHKLGEVMEICDRMSVMRDGKMIGTALRANTDQRQLATMMVGREVILKVVKEAHAPGRVVLELAGVTVTGALAQKNVVDGVSFTLRAGEVLGVAGIEGNGQSELVEAVTGLRPVAEGRILLAGRDVTAVSARARRESGLSHIPEDRNARGLVTSFSSAMNAILGDHYRPPFAGRFGFIDERAVESYARRLIEAYDVRPPSTSVTAANLSGGNAQKLIVARELERGPKLLIASQPTRGVDIGAIEFIHKQIITARDAGLAVLLVSADLSEVMNLSDRILVMFEGRVMGELSQAEADPETLGLLMAGSSLSGGGLEPAQVAWQDAHVSESGR